VWIENGPLVKGQILAGWLAGQITGHRVFSWYPSLCCNLLNLKLTYIEKLKNAAELIDFGFFILNPKPCQEKFGGEIQEGQKP
jgi:hypothetical protein